MRGVLDPTLCDKISSTYKIEQHDITEILLKVMSNAIFPPPSLKPNIAINDVRIFECLEYIKSFTLKILCIYTIYYIIKDTGTLIFLKNITFSITSPLL